MASTARSIQFLPGMREVPQRKPRRTQRPVLWESMLGTVNAHNTAQGTRYFDYDHEGAIAWSGVEQADDVRAYRLTPALIRERADLRAYGLRRGQMVIWA